MFTRLRQLNKIYNKNCTIALLRICFMLYHKAKHLTKIKKLYNQLMRKKNNSRLKYGILHFSLSESHLYELDMLDVCFDGQYLKISNLMFSRELAMNFWPY